MTSPRLFPDFLLSDGLPLPRVGIPQLIQVSGLLDRVSTTCTHYSLRTSCTLYLATCGCSREKWFIRMPNGKLHVPSTLTTRKFVNRTLNPTLCKQRATFRAATFAASLLRACTAYTHARFAAPFVCENIYVKQYQKQILIIKNRPQFPVQMGTDANTDIHPSVYI